MSPYKVGASGKLLLSQARQVEADQGIRPDLLSSAERTELAQLRGQKG
ncbi:hypothetical protein M2271_003042 [Streptomyces sp. LBL]|nr:hypothetical protein [Streptomyces sp. LBL]MDH6625238.1 hypothetical protein [Streptomyces sp. LBL]